MKKIIAANLIFCICSMPLLAETTNVDYKRSDGTVTRVSYQTTGNNTTVSTRRYTQSQYEEQQKKDAIVGLIGAILKAIFSPSKK